MIKNENVINLHRSTLQPEDSREKSLKFYYQSSVKVEKGISDCKISQANLSSLSQNLGVNQEKEKSSSMLWGLSGEERWESQHRWSGEVPGLLALEQAKERAVQLVHEDKGSQSVFSEKKKKNNTESLIFLNMLMQYLQLS